MKSDPSEDTSSSRSWWIGASEQPGDLDVVRDRILQAALGEFQADVCALYIVNPVTGRCLPGPNHAGNLLKTTERWLQAPRPDGLARAVLKQGLVLVPDLRESPEWSSTFAEEEGIQAFAALALREHRSQESLATLYIDFRQVQDFDQSVRSRLQTFAEQAASLLQTTWLLARFREVGRIGSEINQELDTVENLFQKLVRHVAGIFDISYFFMLGIYSWKRDIVDLHYRFGGRDGRCRDHPLNGPLRQVFETGKRVESWSQDRDPTETVLALDDLPKGQRLESRTQLYLPLKLRELPLGVLSVHHPEDRVFDHEDFDVLELLANHVAAALSNIRVFQILDRLSRTGQDLTENLEEPVDRLAEVIREVTEADLAVVYLYFEEQGELLLPPKVAGDLRRPEFPQPYECGKDEIPYRVLKLKEPLFLPLGDQIWEQLGRTRPTHEGGDFQHREAVASVAALPIRAEGETAGILFLNFRRRQPFDAPQKRLIRGLAAFAATAVRNARRFEAVGTRRSSELEILQEIDRLLSRSAHHQTVMQGILELANTLLEAEDASIMLVESDSGEELRGLWAEANGKRQLFVASAIGQHADGSMGWTTGEVESSITGWVLENRQTVRIEDLQSDERWRKVAYPLRPKTRSELDVPILNDDDEIVGVLNFESSRPGAFTEDDQKFVKTLANQVAIAVQRAQDYEIAQKRAEERGILMDLSRQIIGQIEIEQLLETILKKAIQTAEARCGVLLLFDSERQDLEIRFEQGVPRDSRGERIPLDQGIVGRVARDRQPLNVDPTDPEWRDVYLPYITGMRSVLAVPMLQGKRCWGVINIESPKPRQFGDRALRLMLSLANMAVIALQNAERYEAAEKGRERLKALREVTSRIIAEAKDIDRVTREVIRQALSLTNAVRGDLVLYDEGKPAMVYSAEKGSESNGRWYDEGAEYSGGIIDHVAATGRSYRSVDTRTDPLYRGEKNLRSELAVPLNEEAEGKTVLIGVLNVESERPFAFKPSDTELLKLFADEVVLAIQNASSLETAERELERFHELVEAGEKLGSFSSIDELGEACETAAKLAAEQCDSLAVVRAFDEAAQELVLVTRAGGTNGEQLFDRMAVERGLNGVVFRERELRYLHDVYNPRPEDPPCEAADPETRSLVVTPVQFRDHYYGNLGMSHPSPRHFDKSDFSMARGLANLLAVTYHRLQAVEQRKELEEKQRTAEIVTWMGEASYEIAHRLGTDLGPVRTRMNFIRDRLEVLGVQDETIDDNQTRVTQKVQEVLNASKRLVEEVRQFSIAAPAEVKIEQLFEDTVEEFRDRPPSIELRSEIEPGTANLMAVRQHTDDILFNLVKNAIEAMPDGRGTIRLRARNQDRFVAIAVIDDGHGIAKKELTKIFGFRFSTKKGSGFGLWSSQRKAKLSSGNLTVKSEEGVGTEFTLTLPRAEPPLEAMF